MGGLHTLRAKVDLLDFFLFFLFSYYGHACIQGSFGSFHTYIHTYTHMRLS